MSTGGKITSVADESQIFGVSSAPPRAPTGQGKSFLERVGVERDWLRERILGGRTDRRRRPVQVKHPRALPHHRL